MNRTGPMVTIGIPLYRAQSFVENLVTDIEAIDYRNLEILISDQHLHDDAMMELKERLGSDPRVQFFESRNEIPWFENYNLLLRRATGDYFRLFAQDDRLPPQTIGAGVDHLERASDAVLLCGPVDVIDASGSLVQQGPKAYRPVRSALLDSLGLFSGMRHREASLGLIRRAAIVDAELLLQPTHEHSGLSARAWFFGISLRGEVHFAADYLNQRRVHVDSFTSQHWQRSLLDEVRRLFSYYRVGLVVWRQRWRSPLRRLLGVPILFLAGVVLLPLIRVAQRLAPRTRRLLDAGGRRASK